MKAQLMNNETSIMESNVPQASPHIQEPGHGPHQSTVEKAIANVALEGEASVAPRTAWTYAVVFGAAVISGLLVSACFFPLSLGGLAWVALVPFLLMMRSRVLSIWIYLCAFVMGSVWFWLTLSWMPATNDLMRMAWYATSVYCALYLPFAVFFTRLLQSRMRLPLVLAAPIAWTALDFLRSFGTLGFAWYFLGHSQHIFLPVIQIADLGGVYPITFIIVMVNVVVCDWLCTFGKVRYLFRIDDLHTPKTRQTLPWRRTIAVAALALATLVYGFWRLSQGPFEPGPRVALLQANIDQNIRNGLTQEQKTAAVGRAKIHIAQEMKQLCETASSFPDKIDLMIWPETSFPGLWPDINRDIPIQKVPQSWEKAYVDSHDQMRAVANGVGNVNMLVGLNTIYLAAPKNEVWYNSALFVHGSGTVGERYDKIHRLPWGEYNPVADWPLVKNYSPYEDLQYGILAGKKLKRFKLNDYSFGVLICYEDSDPVLARQYGTSKNAGVSWDPIRGLENWRRWIEGIEQEEGPPVDFLVNMSNDGWYAGTSEHNEHLAISRFRAVETRRALVRAVNMGISAVVDGNGRVLQPGHFDPPKLRKGGHYLFYWAVDAPAYVNSNMPLSLWNEFKGRSGVLVSLVPIDNRMSLYSLWGDWFAYACSLVVVLCLAGGSLRFVGRVFGRKVEPA